jgi:hypothetical protein
LRSTLRLFAAGLVLAFAGQALAATPSYPSSPSMGGGSATPDTGTTSEPGTSSSANPAASAGSNTSATAGGFTVGEPVKDNTGTTIGEISALNPGPNGVQMAVIKMGSDSFQVQTDRLGQSNGAATINLSQSQISGMLKSKGGGASTPSGQ